MHCRPRSRFLIPLGSKTASSTRQVVRYLLARSAFFSKTYRQIESILLEESLLSDACTKAFEAAGLTSPRELLKKGVVIAPASLARI